MSILVLGSIHIDLVVRGKRLPAPGETVTGGSFSRGFGGKGANQAVAAARLVKDATRHLTANNAPLTPSSSPPFVTPWPVTMLGAVGDDEFGRECLAKLTREGIQVEYIKTIPDTPTGLALIAVDEVGRNQISVASGASGCLNAGDVETIPDRCFVPGGIFLACQEVPLPAVWAGLRRARRAGMITVLNPAPAVAPLARDVAALIDWIIPNEHEAAITAGLDPFPPPACDASGPAVSRREPTVIECDAMEHDAMVRGQRAAKRLVDMGCRNAITTLGELGGVVWGEYCERYPAFAVRAVDTTAAGDAFCGALAVALQERRPLPDAVRFAAAAAALTVTRTGAQSSLPTRADCLELSQLSEA
ncbi:MAG: Ribokinase [Planctomycetota bacterium]